MTEGASHKRRFLAEVGNPTHTPAWEITRRGRLVAFDWNDLNEMINKDQVKCLGEPSSCIGVPIETYYHSLVFESVVGSGV